MIGAEFQQAIRAAGLNPPEVIEPGKFYRFPGIGKRNDNTAGWCKQFPDGTGGVFGDFAAGFSEAWQAKRDKPMSEGERREWQERIEREKREAEAARAPDSDTSSNDSETAGAQAQGWQEPLPLIAKVEPEPYPLDALPASIRAAVEEVQGFTKAPIPLVASSALAALSLAIQAHADVKRAEKLTGP